MHGACPAPVPFVEQIGLMSSFIPNDLLGFWSEWVRPSAGLPTVLWSLLLAAAAAAGHLVQRYTGMPKVVGYSVVGTVVGLAGFEGAMWPLQGISLFLLELGVAIVLFEAGGRLPLRWFRHNPMVLVQSLLEATLTYLGVFWTLHWMDVSAEPPRLFCAVACAMTRTRADRVRVSGCVAQSTNTFGEGG
jgi:Kef-type K+ transport system membrane component KefB